jgi:hypothetical protein
MKTNIKKLSQLTHIIRSKNAGPFELTLDMIFLNKEVYERVKQTGIITKDLIKKLYNISEEQIITFAYFDAANAIKVTLVRPRPQASIGETDMHACQQHVPLLDIEIPWIE